jgi:hypothetical protein
MKPETIKTTGYLVSTLSVALLGVAAWPGAKERGLIPALVLGMAASVAGMAFRWWSYAVERRTQANVGEDKQRRAPPSYSLSKSKG